MNSTRTTVYSINQPFPMLPSVRRSSMRIPAYDMPVMFDQSNRDQFTFPKNRCTSDPNPVDFGQAGARLTLSPSGVDCAGAELRSRLLFNPIGTFCSRSEAYGLVNGLRWTKVGALAGSVLGIFLMSDWQKVNWLHREWDFAEIYDNSPSRSIATNPNVFTNYIFENPGASRDASQSLLGYSPGTEIRACLSLTNASAKFTVNGITREYPIPADRPNDQQLRWFINAYSPKGWADNQNVKNTVELLLNEVCYDPDPTVSDCLQQVEKEFYIISNLPESDSASLSNNRSSSVLPTTAPDTGGTSGTDWRIFVIAGSFGSVLLCALLFCLYRFLGTQRVTMQYTEERGVGNTRGQARQNAPIQAHADHPPAIQTTANPDSRHLHQDINNPILDSENQPVYIQNLNIV